ncbi:MAG: response regulator [Dehalococcoidia bacterium]|nr:MAG: response regulator [Dehalococcoidia bacterium]
MPNAHRQSHRVAGVIQTLLAERVVAAQLHSPCQRLRSPGTVWDMPEWAAPELEFPRDTERAGGVMIESLPSRTSFGRNRASTLVFVIEDEDAIRKLVQDTLEGEGYRVGSARSAEDAIVMLDQISASLILLDLRLPGMDGFAFINAYRARKNSVNVAPIILMSALRPREELPEGVVGYLRKPFDLDDLLSRVEHALATY